MTLLLSAPDIQTAKYYSTHRGNRFDRIHFYYAKDLDDNNDDVIETPLQNWRFRLTIIDVEYKTGRHNKIKCAIFLIPAGRESEFLFATKQGLKSVAESKF